ncbi:unnamed protein product [Lactuca virosa]|uniref:Protein arginine N-methyltransferase domain-containing protein n=1 Tax=Lactuca virosa TaxID=75947 RepID=A0AAU9LQ71_9ASTR|nr:unnamed protein product [Lactuca virosa]
MNWHLQTEFNILHSLSGNLMDFFEGLTYEHVNFIFSDVTYPQDSTNYTMNTSSYNFAYSEPGNFSYYGYFNAYAINDPIYGKNGFTRQLENTSTMANERSTYVHMQQNGHSTSNSHTNPSDNSQSNHNHNPNHNHGDHHQVVWEDNVNLDNMTYEEQDFDAIGYLFSLVRVDVSARNPEHYYEVMDLLIGENVLTWPHVVKHVDCYTITLQELESVTTNFKFQSMMRAPFHGFAFWFDVEFCGPAADNDAPSSESTKSNPRRKRANPNEALVLSTAPEDPPTHWQQNSLSYCKIWLGPKVNITRTLQSEHDGEDVQVHTDVEHQTYQRRATRRGRVFSYQGIVDNG